MPTTTREIEIKDSAALSAGLEGYQQTTEDLVGEKLVINMGPSHPATHGVLRIVLELDGEVITKADPDVGYLHRGDEKIAENMQYNQFVPYTDRLDYLAPLANNVAYALAVEKLMGWELPARGQAIRTICCEMARISAHLLGIGAYAMDVGAMTVFLYTFTQRETIYNLCELLTGARFTTSYTRIWPRVSPTNFSSSATSSSFASTRSISCSHGTRSSSAAPATSASFPKRTPSPGASAARISAARESITTSARPTPTSTTTATSLTSRSARSATATTAISSAWKRCARASASCARPSPVCPTAPSMWSMRKSVSQIKTGFS